MGDIKAGDYIRTKQGYIARIIETSPRYIWCDNTIMKNSGIPVYGINIDSEINVIVKHSKNIIDLIEVGDYVNCRLVLQVDYKNKNVCLLISLSDTKANTNICWYGFEDIKSIVTKEQFANIEYKVNT